MLGEVTVNISTLSEIEMVLPDWIVYMMILWGFMSDFVVDVLRNGNEFLVMALGALKFAFQPSLSALNKVNNSSSIELSTIRSTLV
jgi:hypothetical protein